MYFITMKMHFITMKMYFMKRNYNIVRACEDVAASLLSLCRDTSVRGEGLSLVI